MATPQLTNTDLYLHQARMLHIRGNVEQSLALYYMLLYFDSRYKHILQGMLQNAKQYPQYSNYYRSYINLVLEEAEAIKEVESKKNQIEEPIRFYIPQDDEPVENTVETEPTPYPIPPTFPTQPTPVNMNTQNSNPTSLTASDLQYVAAGMINGLQNFDREYNVSDKCKQAYSTCSNKAKEINEKYEVRSRLSFFI